MKTVVNTPIGKEDYQSENYEQILTSVINKYLSQVCCVNPWKTPYDDVCLDELSDRLNDGVKTRQDVADAVTEIYIFDEPKKQLEGWPDIKEFGKTGFTGEYSPKVGKFIAEKADDIYLKFKKAVDAVVERAKDPSARSLNTEQKEVLKNYVQEYGNFFGKNPFAHTEKKEIYKDVIDAANERFASLKIDKAWAKDAIEEVTDLANGMERGNNQGIKL